MDFCIAFHTGKSLLIYIHDYPFIGYIWIDRSNLFCRDRTECFCLPPENVTGAIFFIQPVPDLTGFVDADLIYPDNLAAVEARWQVDGGNILQPGARAGGLSRTRSTYGTALAHMPWPKLVVGKLVNGAFGWFRTG
jgi:hypothetical protein